MLKKSQTLQLKKSQTLQLKKEKLKRNKAGLRWFIQPMPTFKKNIYKKVRKIVGIG
jgi:hypothetical protein